MTMGEEGRRKKLFMSERNTSQLPRLLCCTMEKEGKTPLAGGGGEGETVCCISESGPGDQWGQERGWGRPGGAGHQRMV